MISVIGNGSFFKGKLRRRRDVVIGVERVVVGTGRRKRLARVKVVSFDFSFSGLSFVAGLARVSGLSVEFSYRRVRFLFLGFFRVSLV